MSELTPLLISDESVGRRKVLAALTQFEVGEVISISDVAFKSKIPSTTVAIVFEKANCISKLARGVYRRKFDPRVKDREGIYQLAECDIVYRCPLSKHLSSGCPQRDKALQMKHQS